MHDFGPQMTEGWKRIICRSTGRRRLMGPHRISKLAAQDHLDEQRNALLHCDNLPPRLSVCSNVLHPIAGDDIEPTRKQRDLRKDQRISSSRPQQAPLSRAHRSLVQQLRVGWSRFSCHLKTRLSGNRHNNRARSAQSKARARAVGLVRNRLPPNTILPYHHSQSIQVWIEKKARQGGYHAVVRPARLLSGCGMK